MTDYERMSLRLLSQIAVGISFQATQAALSTPEAKQRHAEAVLRWQQQLMAVLTAVAAAVGDDAGDEAVD